MFRFCKYVEPAPLGTCSEIAPGSFYHNVVDMNIVKNPGNLLAIYRILNRVCLVGFHPGGCDIHRKM